MTKEEAAKVLEQNEDIITRTSGLLTLLTTALHRTIDETVTFTEDDVTGFELMALKARAELRELHRAIHSERRRSRGAIPAAIFEADQLSEEGGAE